MGERICRDDSVRRWILFRYLVQSVMSYGVEIWGWEEKKELEKIMMDYIRWIFKIDFCTPRYIISRELGMEKLRVGWGIRAKRYEEKILNREEGCFLKVCWSEKEEGNWNNAYGKEREKYYNRNGWGVEILEKIRDNEQDLEVEIITRESELQRQWEGNRIMETKYNKRYKEIKTEGQGPRYLRKAYVNKIGIGNGVRALIKLRCGNLEEANKYWLSEEGRVCIFCENGQDNLRHYVEECVMTKGWFDKLGKEKQEIWERIWDDDLDENKSLILSRLWREREKKLKEIKVKRELGQEN